MVYNGHSRLKTFILLGSEQDKEMKKREMERGRRKEHAKLVQARAETQDKGYPLHWASVSPPPSTPSDNKEQGFEGRGWDKN